MVMMTSLRTAKRDNMTVADRVMTLKTICPQAYAFPYGDPYSTFTCGTKEGPALNYKLTACPS